jgi:hypothetical protein
MILPPFITFFIISYWSILVKFFNDYLIETALGHARHHLLVKLNKKLDFAPLEKLAAGYHHQSGPGAQVTHSSNKLIRAFLVKYLDKLSLRSLEERLYSDMIIRWFVGYTLFETPPDHTTLERFEMWLNKHHHKAIFDEILRQIRNDYPDEYQIQIGDTYAMRARATRENLQTLLQHLSEHLLEAGLDSLPFQMEIALRGFEWTPLFGIFPDKNEYKLDKEQRTARLLVTARAAQDLHQRFTLMLKDRPQSEFPALRRQLGYLGKVLTDEFAKKDTEWERLPPKEQGSLRLGSATDPEATYRVHGPDPEDTSFGYNVQVAVTKNGFVSATFTETGACPDQAGVAKLISEQKERQGICPEKLIYDQAAGCGKTRADVEKVSEGQTQLVSLLPNYAARSDRFGPYAFTLSEDGKTLTCPNGKSTSVAYQAGSGDGRDFRFHDFQCWSGPLPKGKKAPDPSQVTRCPLWEQCRKADQGPRTMRQVFVSDYREQVLAAREYNEADEFKQYMKMRPSVERVIFELTHYNDARECRRLGLNNADWQARMTATAYNLKHWIRLSDRRQMATKA